MVDLDAYFSRVGAPAPATPSREALDALCLAHVKAIPFENLDVLLGRGIDLSDEAIEQKLLHDGRGGYCFEQNTLFARVLKRLGFQTQLVSARVRLQRPRDFTPPRTHVFNLVELEGERWVADVGVGGLSPTAAFRLDTEAVQPTPHEARRVVKEGGLYFHQAWLGEAWADVWESTLEPMPAIDREVANWFTSAHPQSHFRNRLLAARALDGGGRVTLLNQELTVRRPGIVQTLTLETPEALLDALDEHFALRFPTGTRFNGPPFAWAR
ncbi:MAG: arylamine N-acetyltransferase [Myxococcaceae bacterium]|nr:arylamine N-acetyltransferase [Myxococcaceae bacterium]